MQLRKIDDMTNAGCARLLNEAELLCLYVFSRGRHQESLFDSLKRPADTGRVVKIRGDKFNIIEIYLSVTGRLTTHAAYFYAPLGEELDKFRALSSSGAGNEDHSDSLFRSVLQNT